MPIPPTWSRTAQRMGVSSALALLIVGVLYVVVILGWLLLEGTPSEPIGDPYLAAMEGLTIVSGLALVGFCAAVASLCDPERQILGLMTVVSAALAAELTMSVHFAQLTAIQQMWRAGAVEVQARLALPAVRRRVPGVGSVRWRRHASGWSVSRRAGRGGAGHVLH